MVAKGLTREAIANTEKKLDMPLDDIIKMSKTNTMKPKKQQRPSNKIPRMFNNSAKDKALSVRRYMESRPFVRQGALAQRRSNFQGNQFPMTTAVARKAGVAPDRNRPSDRTPMVYPNKARAGAFAVNRRPTNGGYAAKPPQSQQQHQPVEGNTIQKPQTLDALFANIKQRRMKFMSRPNNNTPWTGSGGRSTMLPWARGRNARWSTELANRES